ncbi:subtilisin-like serine protease [Ceratobasidium sp. 392]|nr:subtilisin-like serine protease [Ceratobasidium sp. 392]
MLFPTVLGALTLVVPALGAPTVVPITKRAGQVKPDSYIVTFKDDLSKAAFMSTGPSFAQPGSSVTYDYTIIPAAAMVVNPSDLNMVQKAPGVESIEPDGIVSIHYEFGLDGIAVEDSHEPAVRSERLEKRSNNGRGVDIYGIDTGIFTGHNCFGGRARWGATFGGYQDKDGNGHGTHTAGTAACSNFKPGVAGEATIFAVKVLSDEGSGSNTDVIMGVEYALNATQASGKPSTATMSLGGMRNEALNSAMGAAISKGLHFTVAAGNNNLPADGFSPASVKEANTIGAVDSDNKKASFSNFGRLIDVWYYGVDVESAWIDGPNSTKVLSGTSMATPGVAGILAAHLSMEGNGGISPAELTKRLQEHAQHVVKNEAGIPIMPGSTDLLAVPF